MLAAGIQVGGLKDGEAPKKPSFDKKKGKGKKADKVSLNRGYHHPFPDNLLCITLLRDGFCGIHSHVFGYSD